MAMVQFTRVSFLAATGFLSLSTPVFAEEEGTNGSDMPQTSEGSVQERPQGPPPVVGGQGGPPPGVAGGPPGGKPVFDDTWITLGIGAGLVPSYSGSDNYRVFPLPLIVGRVGGVGITPNGPGLVFDLLSQPPKPGKAETSLSFGPVFRIRSDRDGHVQDNVVDLADNLETAVEVGVQGGVTFPGVLNPFDRLSLSTQVRWDILGAHEGMLVEPGVSYLTPLSRGVALQMAASLSFVDDAFADYYYTVTPAQSAATGLPQFSADGGLNSIGALSILTFDLGGNLLDGGFNIYTVAGYSRLVGDAADTPFTAQRGSSSQFIGGVGVGYTF